MLYAFICEDVENSLDQRLQIRPEHLQRLEDLQNEGRLVLAGPHPKIDSNEGRLVLAGPHPKIDSPEPGTVGFSGSLIVAEFPSLEAAEQWASEDPYLKAGVYARVTVKPFKQVLPQ